MWAAAWRRLGCVHVAEASSAAVVVRGAEIVRGQVRARVVDAIEALHGTMREGVLGEALVEIFPRVEHQSE